MKKIYTWKSNSRGGMSNGFLKMNYGVDNNFAWMTKDNFNGDQNPFIFAEGYG